MPRKRYELAKGETEPLAFIPKVHGSSIGDVFKGLSSRPAIVFTKHGSPDDVNTKLVSMDVDGSGTATSRPRRFPTPTLPNDVANPVDVSMVNSSLRAP